MAPDSFEPDHLASDADTSGQPEITMHEPQPAVPRGLRPSLFQMVCLQSKPRSEPQSSA